MEIGTSKVAVLIGEFNHERSLHIIGMGECASEGVTKGAIVDFKAASESTQRALLAAEQSAGVRIKEVILAQSGGHLDGCYNEASVTVSVADNRVDRADIHAVCQLAKSKSIPAGRSVVHHIRRPFRLDGRLVSDPRHLVGRRLEVGYWTVHGQEALIANQLYAIRGFGLDVQDIVLSSLASGAVLTTPEDRQNGVLVIDIGAGTTDYALYRDGCAQITGVLPVGGSHLTNDLGLGLRLATIHAEKLKLLYGRAQVATRDRKETVLINDVPTIGEPPIRRLPIEQITAVRTRETFEVVRKKLNDAFLPETTAAGVLLTGGMSLLPGIETVAANVFGVTACRAEPPEWVVENLRDPRYSTVLGLLSYGLDAQGQSQKGKRWGVRSLWREFFGAGS